MSAATSEAPAVRSVRRADHDRWRQLYAGYAAFYRVEQTDQMAEDLWTWLHDPTHEVEGLVAVDGADNPIGLVHVRSFARPLSASTGGFLDDLFVEPSLRGTGAAGALLDAVSDLAHARGWSVVRWITADDNYRARTVYDRRAERTAWVTYDMTP